MPFVSETVNNLEPVTNSNSLIVWLQICCIRFMQLIRQRPLLFWDRAKALADLQIFLLFLTNRLKSGFCGCERPVWPHGRQFV